MSSASGGENDETMLRLKEENMQLKCDMARKDKENMQLQLQQCMQQLQSEREKSDRKEKEYELKDKESDMKDKKIAKLKGSLATKDKLLSSRRAEVGRRIISEQQANAKNEVLQRELAVATQPTIQYIVKVYDEAVAYAKSDPLFDLYERIMSLSDEKLLEETKFIVDERDNCTALRLAAMHGFPHAALSRLVQCGCDVEARLNM
jgi:hypothetical protein